MVPDYYKDFTCKCGECHDVCCGGWGITLSFAEFNRVFGINCKKALRRKIDRAFYIADHPTNERYALINEGWDGYCPLIDEEGYCSLQRACGEEVLPTVCRMYPRSIKKGKVHELSCSGSCEETLELLMKNREKIHFEEVELDMPENVGVISDSETPERISMRRRAIEKMGDRAEPLSVRLYTIGKIVCGASENAPETEKTPVAAGENEIFSLTKIILRFEEISDALRECAESALLNIGITQENYLENGVMSSSLEKYLAAREHFYALFPDADVYFEKIMINHMFYEQFPYADFDERCEDAYLALCAAYAILKFICVAYMADKSEKSDFVHAAGEIFRFVEHTDFYHNAMIALKKEGYETPDSVFPIICL